jgi:hypothetical protein
MMRVIRRRIVQFGLSSNELDVIHGSDLEVVDTSSLVNGP